MTAKFRDAFSRVRSNLTSLDSQPISKAALVIILFLDIFILTSIFNGLDEHTRQLASPDDSIPYYCREIVINSRLESHEPDRQPLADHHFAQHTAIIRSRRKRRTAIRSARLISTSLTRSRTTRS